MKRLVAVILMTLVVVGTSVTGSEAGTIKVWPYELTPFTPDIPYSKGPSYVRSDLTPDDELVNFWAVVKLPVGKIIKNLKYFYNSSSSTGESYVYLYRYSMEGNSPEIVTQAGANGNSAGIIPVENLLPIPKEFRKIKRGYIYYVLVGSGNSNSLIRGIQITYK